MKVCRSVISFDHGDRPPPFQDPSKTRQSFDRIREMLQDKAQEHMIVAVLRIRQVEDIALMKRNVRESLRGDALSRGAKGFLRQVDGGKCRLGAVARQYHRLRADAASRFQHPASRRVYDIVVQY